MLISNSKDSIEKNYEQLSINNPIHHKTRSEGLIRRNIKGFFKKRHPRKVNEWSNQLINQEIIGRCNFIITYISSSKT